MTVTSPVNPLLTPEPNGPEAGPEPVRLVSVPFTLANDHNQTRWTPPADTAISSSASIVDVNPVQKTVTFHKDSRRERFAKDVANAIQHSATCVITDVLVDPQIGKFFQNRFGTNKVSLDQTRTAEAIGDTVGFAAFVGLSGLFPGAIDAMKNQVKSIFTPFYNALGKRSLAGWAHYHHVDEHSDLYRAKLEQWKDFQARSLVNSSIISAASIAVNVTAQRTISRNTNSLLLITGSKVAGQAVTMGFVVGMRLLFPRTASQFEQETSDRYISPIFRGTQSLLGVKPSGMSETEIPDASDKDRDPVPSAQDRWAGTQKPQAAYTARVAESRQQPQAVQIA